MTVPTARTRTPDDQSRPISAAGDHKASYALGRKPILTGCYHPSVGELTDDLSDRRCAIARIGLVWLSTSPDRGRRIGPGRTPRRKPSRHRAGHHANNQRQADHGRRH